MLVALMVWAAQAVPAIVGSGDCPEPAVVSQKVATLLPAASDGDPAANRSPPPPSVHLSRTLGGELEILLLASDGRRLDERHLSASSGCDDLAAAAAVVVATWASAPEPSVPERVEFPRPDLARPLRDAPPSVVAEARSPSVPALARRSSSTATLRLGAVASSAGEQWAAGVRMSGGLRLWGERWGLGAIVAATLPHSQSVDGVPDAARWTRGHLGVGPEVTLLSGQVTLKAHLQGLLGLLHVTGNGLDMTTSDIAVRLGAAAGVWSAWQGWHGVWPWIGADLLLWPGRERLRIAGVAGEGTIPSLDGQVAAGVGVDLFP